VVLDENGNAWRRDPEVAARATYVTYEGAWKMPKV
jgi:hypothetical protein